jgi:hypothetical protein
MSNIQIETDLKEILRELKEGQKAILNKVEETNKRVEDIDKRLVRVETNQRLTKSANLDIDWSVDYCGGWFCRSGRTSGFLIQSLISNHQGC